MSRRVLTALALLGAVGAGAPGAAEATPRAGAATIAGAATARPAAVRIQVVSGSQAAVTRSRRLRVRVAARAGGRLRLGGRVFVRRSGRVRALRLTRRRVVRLRRGRARTLLLRLLPRGARALRSAQDRCAGSTVEVFAVSLARFRRPRTPTARRSLRRDLRRCLRGTPPGGPGSGYRVGVAARSINPGADGRFAGAPVYLGGYGFGGPPASAGRPATGILGDGAHVRAFAAAAPGGAFAIADIETQGWFAAVKDGPYGLIDIRRAVERRTGGALPASAVVVQSAHSHSGADTMGVWGGVPLAYRRMIAERTADAIVEAFQTMRPGSLFYGTAPGGDLLSNQFAYDAANRVMDSDVRVLQARTPDGRPFATLLDFSAHATVLDGENTKLSGDWVQAANTLLAQRFGGEPMTVVATLGRTQPADRGCGAVPLPPPGPARDLCTIRSYAERVVERAEDAAIAARPLSGPPLVGARSYLIRDAGTNALILGLDYAGAPAGLPLNRSLAPPWLTGNVLGTVTSSVRIGDVLLSGMPGEAYPQIPLDVAARAPARGYMTAGLAGDQLGYLIAPYRAYSEPIRRSFFNQRGDQVSPLDNDNYFFNVSPTIGERVDCSLLRGAGELFGRGGALRDGRSACLPFVTDALAAPGSDTR